MRRRVGVAAMLAAIVLAAPAVAQQPGGGAGRGGMRGMMAAPSSEELTKELSLNAKQQETLIELLMVLETDTKDAREAMMENMQMVRDGSVTMDAVREDNRKAMATLREANQTFNKKFKTILTDEQKTAYDAWLAKRAANRGQGRRPPA